MSLTNEKRIQKNHIVLMKHPQTSLFAGIMMLGDTEVRDGVPTAYTDGVNKVYGSAFIKDMPDAKLRGLILHENLHVAFKHLTNGREMFDENPLLANMAADYVVNAVIHDLDGVTPTNEPIATLPDNALYDKMFTSWSMRQVYNYLKKQQQDQDKDKDKDKDQGEEKQGQGQGGGQQGQGEGQDQPSQGQGQGQRGTLNVNGKDVPMDSLDEHDFKQPASAEEAKQFEQTVDRALRQGGITAGRLGGKMPRAIDELLAPKVNWREALREFISAHTRGTSEYTWRRLNRRHLANDIYMPSTIDESVDDIVVAIDTSGSISQIIINEFASELASICEVACPKQVRVLWWDTMVNRQQVFDENSISNIASLLKPAGGGGTRAACVSEFIINNNINPNCIVMLTDAYLEPNVKWETTAPTLWAVTQDGNAGFTPPAGGKLLKMED